MPIAVVAHAQMDVREIGLAAHADQAQGLPGGDRIAHSHPDAALAQVAILRLPAVGMAQQHAVAAVRFAEIVASRPSGGWSGMPSRTPLTTPAAEASTGTPGCHALRVGDGEVGAVMAVGAQRRRSESRRSRDRDRDRRRRTSQQS